MKALDKVVALLTAVHLAGDIYDAHRRRRRRAKARKKAKTTTAKIEPIGVTLARMRGAQP